MNCNCERELASKNLRDKILRLGREEDRLRAKPDRTPSEDKKLYLIKCEIVYLGTQWVNMELGTR